jgi:hypothetical protein
MVNRSLLAVTEIYPAIGSDGDSVTIRRITLIEFYAFHPPWIGRKGRLIVQTVYPAADVLSFLLSLGSYKKSFSDFAVRI